MVHAPVDFDNATQRKQGTGLFVSVGILADVRSDCNVRRMKGVGDESPTVRERQVVYL